jgi:hypothetical protein
VPACGGDATCEGKEKERGFHDWFLANNNYGCKLALPTLFIPVKPPL